MHSNKFYNIHTYSWYSLLKANLSIIDIVNFSVENKLDYAILCDNNLSGAIEFYYCCLKHQVKPVIGLDWYYYDSHYLLLAKNNQGYHNLIKFESFTKLDKDFNPNTLTNDLIVIHLKGKEIITKQTDYYHHDDLAINHAAVLNKQQLIVLDLLNCIKNDLKFDEHDLNYTHSHHYLLTYQEAINYFNDEQINKTVEIIHQCDWVIEKQKNKLAKYKIPENFSSSYQYLEHLCLLGLKDKICKNNSLIDKQYIERLNHELEIINSMGYNDYFLIVADFVNWAKQKNILIGPGRGSAAGSLVAYAMNITNVDPVKNNLIFERFLNIDRKTLPDIDIDIMDTRRQELIDYIFDKYNPENTSYISTFQRIKTKMAIRDIGRILDVDIKIIDAITKSIANDSDDELSWLNNDRLKKYYEMYPKLFEYAKLIINVPRQISTHAAGIIISDQALWNYLPVMTGIDNWLLSEFTMDYLESLGLFKMDILGLKNLSIIDEVLNLIKRRTGKNIDLDKIALDDQKLFNDISNGNTLGIFQLESPGMTSTVMKIKPQSIEDISICSALFRPGPQALIPDYVKTRNGLKEPTYLNQELQEVLSPTLGFCIYQEQVIKLIQIVTNFTASQADVFRRAISKKKEELFLTMKEEFLEAAIRNNYDKEQAEKIYEFILEFANYGFNHSHSLAYSYISYQMMYLKYYYPLEFYVILLKHSDSSKQNLYISEAKRKNIKTLNINICLADYSFSIVDNNIMFGFSNIKGFGSEITKKILEIRNKYEFNDWQAIIAILFRNKISIKNIEILVKIGAFDSFNVDRNFILLNLDEVTKKASITINDKNVFDINLNYEFTPMTEQEKETHENQYLNYSFSNSNYDELFTKYHEQYHLKNIDIDQLDETANYLIQIRKLKKTVTKYQKPMCFIEFNENDLNYSSASFSEAIFEQLVESKYYIVKLKISSKQNKLQLSKIITEVTI